MTRRRTRSVPLGVGDAPDLKRGDNFFSWIGGEGDDDQEIRTGLLLWAALLLVPLAIVARLGGFPLETAAVWSVRAFLALVTFALTLQWFMALVQTQGSKRDFLSRHRSWSVASALIVPTVLVIASFEGMRIAGHVASFYLLAVLVRRSFNGLLRSRLFAGRPALSLAVTFAIIALYGALLLFVSPAATVDGEGLSFIDALFTATSATCVTGLEVVPTGTRLTHFGQGVVLALIQVGGLGIMTLGTFLLVTAGQRLAISDRELVRDALNLERVSSIGRLVFAIFAATTIIEAAGAILFLPYFEHDPEPVFAAVFHSVSAFCNAGFALRTDSLQSFVGDVGFNSIAMVLITLGGLGFTVIHEIGGRVAGWLGRGGRRRLSLHARLVLLMSALLVVFGAGAFWLLEHRGVLAGRSLSEQVCASTFQSVSARTAGFATVDFVGGEGGEGAIGGATRYFLTSLMFIGASPGSTGGGLKTVTLAVLLLAIVAVFRNRSEPEIMGRTIPGGLVNRAACIAVAYAATVFVAVTALLISDGAAFSLEELLFETVSALATVGFSVGVSSSPDLSSFGKLVLTLIMFAGRLGPLTLVLVTAPDRGARSRVTFPEENVIIG